MPGAAVPPPDEVAAGRPGLRYLVCGNVTLDRRAGGLFVPGGSAFYSSRTAAGLGATVRVATAAGPDFDPAVLGDVALEIRAAEATTVFENVHEPGGRRRPRVLASAGPNAPMVNGAGRPAGAWRTADVLHLAPILNEVTPREWVEAVRAPVVGLGLQGMLRRVGTDGDVHQPRWTPQPGSLDGVGTVFLGEDELVGQDDLVGRLVAAGVPLVVLTRAAHGCEIHAGPRIARVGAYPTHEVDPTGAGDVFAAAFLLALAGGADPVEAARLGAAAGSIAVEGVGGEALAHIGEARARAHAVRVLSTGS